MDYLDLDLEVEAEGGLDYRVAARSLEGDMRETVRFPYSELELENKLLRLQNALLKSGGQRRDAVLSADEQAVQDFGSSLFKTLLGGKVRALYDACRSRAAREGRPGVRLRLRILAPNLAALPWEYLYDADRGEYLCLSRRTPLVRYLEVAHPIQPLTIAPPLRILAMIASPSDQPPLKVERERMRLREALKDLEGRGLVKLEWLPGQTWRDLQRAMRGGPWHIFHFIGHGGFHPQAQEGVLALENDEGASHLLGATQLAYLLANHDTLRLALLNACEGATSNNRDLFSSTAATLARRGIPAVLAMQYAITDRAAIECSRAFYEALADGLPVDAALGEARIAIHIGVNNSLEWGTPVLFMRSPDGMLFSLSGQPQPPPAPVVAPPVTPPLAAQQAVPAKAAPTKTAGQWVEEGIQHRIARRYPEALAAYEQAIQLDPGYAAAYCNKGNALSDLKRYEEALAAYEQAIQLAPNDALAYYNKGVTLSDLKRYEEALAAYEQAIQLAPNDALAYNGKGAALRALGRTAEAEQAFKKARDLGYQG